MKRAAITHRSQSEPLLYCAYSEKSAVIKVGVSKDPLRRLGDIKSLWSGAFDGIDDLALARVYIPPSGLTAYTIEAAYKRSMEEYTAASEWFEFTPENFDYQMDVFSAACRVSQKKTPRALCDAAEVIFSIRKDQGEADMLHTDDGCWADNNLEALGYPAPCPRPAPTQEAL